MISSEVVSESEAKMPPLWNQRTPAPKIFVPVEVARLELRRGFVAAVVEDDRPAHAEAAIAVDGRHVRPAHAVVLEHLVERRDAHRPDAAGDELADRVLDHGCRNAGSQAEAVGQVGCRVELAAAHVNLARVRLAERDHARVEAVDERSECEEIEGAFGRYVQSSRCGGHQCVSLPFVVVPSPVQSVWNTPSRSTRR